MQADTAMHDATYFIDKADQCFVLSDLAGANSELAAALKAMGNEFLAKAVEIDTERDKGGKAAHEH